MAPNTVNICGEELLATLLNPKREYHPFSAGRDCFFDVLAATVHIKILQFRYLLLIPAAY
jgi:hypothetical protein